MNQITNFIAETKALLAHTYNDRPGLKSTHTLEGMSCGSCVTKITNKLLEHPDIIAAEVTLQPPQATITSRKTLADDDLNTWLQPFGHYRVKSTEAEPSLPAGDATTYRPLILLLLYLLTVTAAVMAASGGWNTSLAMRVFMGGFFIAFSFFKLLDPRGFADAYRGYDLVARKWPAYGLIMIEAIIHWSLKNRFLVACAALLLIALGVRAIYLTPVDAIPDLTENQVLVYGEWMGRSPQEVEDQVTFPLSTGLQGLAGVKEVRATSMFGFSLITIIFEDKVDTYFARARVLERLNYLQASMPEGVKPQLGPDASGLGWVYQYYFDVDPTKAKDGGYDLAQLRSLQDWYVRYQLASVQGVAEVASIGGFVKQYQVELNSTKMRMPPTSRSWM
jgi:copper chaperone CopZ